MVLMSEEEARKLLDEAVDGCTTIDMELSYRPMALETLADTLRLVLP